MKDFKVKYESNHIVAYNKLLFETFPKELFDPDYLKSNFLLISFDEAQHGRGNIYKFEYNKRQLILRHYHRGGMVAKIIDDEYLWTGFNNTRPIRELTMLAKMQVFKLPVPIPVAAHIYRSGWSYRADIITEFIPNAKTLSSCLQEDILGDDLWHQIGITIKKFHMCNCNHADLNAHNILLNENNEIFLIDFDRSKIDDTSKQWHTDNLERLKRSLNKLSSESEKFHYTEKDFTELINGYSNS